MSRRRFARAALWAPLLFGLTACGTTEAPATGGRVGPLAAATAIGSPILAALGGQRGLTARGSLDTLSPDALRAAVASSYALAIDLASLSASGAASDAVIQAAIAAGTPLVFENSAALQAYLSGAVGGAAAQASELAGAAMAAAIGVGDESQIAVVIPTTVPGASADDAATTLFSITSLGAGSQPPALPTTTDLQNWVQQPADRADRGGARQELLPDGYDKPAVPPVTTPPVTDAATLLTQVQSAISAASGRARSTGRATPPSGVTQKEYVFNWPEYVWWPYGKSQDFVIQNAMRVQLIQGSGGQKKFLRCIVADGAQEQGFYNRGSLIWKDDSDKGYLTSSSSVTLETVAEANSSRDGAPTMVTHRAISDWLHFGDRVPGFVEAGYSDIPTETKTSFDVDYYVNNARRTWTSTETRQFDMRLYRLETWPGVDFRWWLYYVDYNADDGDDANRMHSRIDYDWKRMFIYNGWLSKESVRWPQEIARGAGGKALHPKVQSWWWTSGSETRRVKFAYRQGQGVWNTYSHRHASGPDEHCKATDTTLTRYFWVDFKQLSASGG